MKKLVSLFLVLCVVTGIAATTSVGAQARAEKGYAELYVEFANQQSGGDPAYSFFGYCSGIMLADVNVDGVPEMFSYEKTDNDYALKKAATIVDGKVVASEPWTVDGVTTGMNITILPDGGNQFSAGIVEFCEAPSLMLYYDPQPPFDKMINGMDMPDYVSEIWCNEGVFGFDQKAYPMESNYTGYKLLDEPVVMLSYYDEASDRDRSYAETMSTAIEMYKAEKSSATSMQKVSDWAAADVAEAIELGLVPEIMHNEDLTEEITRAEFAGIAAELGYMIIGNELFRYTTKIGDVEGHPYESYIYHAFHMGLTNGTGYDRVNDVDIFSPEMTITREDLATMMSREYELADNVVDEVNRKGYAKDIAAASKSAGFSDHSLISEYAIGAVYFMNGKNIVKGVGDNMFAPKATATREQAIVMALRCYKDMF